MQKVQFAKFLYIVLSRVPYSKLEHPRKFQIVYCFNMSAQFTCKTKYWEMHLDFDFTTVLGRMPTARHARNVKDLALVYMYMYLPCECHNTAAIICTSTVQSPCALLHGCRKNATKRTNTDKVCIADARPHLQQSCKSARPSCDSTIDVKQALDNIFLKYMC